MKNLPTAAIGAALKKAKVLGGYSGCYGGLGARRWRRMRSRCGTGPWELEFADACRPLVIAGFHIVFVRMPEANTVGGIDGRHGIIAPAVGAGLRAAAIGQSCFALAQVI
jgi:hypothetical protein